MNVAQKLSYWSRWARCVAIFRAQGLAPAQIEAKRHAITEKALGYAKSMSGWKTWKNAEVDKVFAAFAAVYAPGDLDAQLDAIDQPDRRFLRVIDEVRHLVGEVIGKGPDDPDQEWAIDKYLSALAHNVCKKASTRCTDPELHKLKGILQRRILQIEKQLLRDAAKQANEGQPF